MNKIKYEKLEKLLFIFFLMGMKKKFEIPKVFKKIYENTTNYNFIEKLLKKKFRMVNTCFIYKFFWKILYIIFNNIYSSSEFISNFSGSAGFAIITNSKNYLFIDGRYLIQSKMESGRNFKIIEIPHTYPKDILNYKNFKRI